MITSLFLRHFKIYKGITFIPISEGCGFSSLIGENGVGKSSVLEALDFAINRKSNSDWPVNNEAKNEGGLSSVFIIRHARITETLSSRSYSKWRSQPVKPHYAKKCP